MSGQKRVALVTGGSSGIGRAICIKFALEEGVAVVNGDVRDQDGQALVDEIKAKGGSAAYVHLDVADEAQWENAVKFTVDTFGALTHLVNNAGISGKVGPLEQTDRADFDKTFAVLATSVMLGCKVASEELSKHPGKATCVNIASIMGLVASQNPHYMAYAAGKGACTLLTKNIAISWAKKGIRCNSVHPGYIESPLLRNMPPAEYQGAVNLHPMGRLGTPEEIADSVLFLSGPKSTFMTGAALVVDGGYTAV